MFLIYVVVVYFFFFFFFFSSRRRHTRCSRDWSSDVCSSDLFIIGGNDVERRRGLINVEHFQPRAPAPRNGDCVLEPASRLLREIDRAQDATNRKHRRRLQGGCRRQRTVRTGHCASLTTWAVVEPKAATPRRPPCAPITIRSDRCSPAVRRISLYGLPEATTSATSVNARVSPATSPSRRCRTSRRWSALTAGRPSAPTATTGSNTDTGSSTCITHSRAAASPASDCARVIALSDAGEKSTAQSTRLNSALTGATAGARAGTVSTGHGALRSSFSVTDPSIRRSKPDRPCDPMTSRSAGRSVASRAISAVTLP